MSPEQRAAIEQRLAAAMPGPWSWRETAETAAVDATYFSHWRLQQADNGSARILKADVGFSADADLIAHAPTDMRALLDENARLRASLVRLTDGELAGCLSEDGVFSCSYCFASPPSWKDDLRHNPDCPITIARAALGTVPREVEA